MVLRASLNRQIIEIGGLNMHALQPHNITLAEYFSMTGLPERTELINGVIYDMVPPGPSHSFTVGELAKYLFLNINDAAIRQEQPIQLFSDNAPQPDIAILKASNNEYRTEHPFAEDVIALIEVSDSTLHYDQHDKMRLYAQSGIPLYYIVDLEHKCMIKHTQPIENTYELIEQTQELSIESLAISLTVSDIT